MIKSNRIVVIPDVQAKPGNDFTFLRRIGQYIVDKKPDTIVCLGDFADMPSLSSYDVGKKCFEGRRYLADIAATKQAMTGLLTPLNDFNAKAVKNKEKQYHPRMVMLLGNHENRINRAVEDDPKLDGVLSVDALGYKEAGWEVIPFLKIIIIDGIAFSHYFVTGVAGRPAGTAAAQLRKTNMSCIAGHQQGKQIAYGHRADGTTITSIITGSCYEHFEDFLGPQTNQQHWRGFLVLNEAHDGAFDEMWVSLGFINNRYPTNW